VSAARGRPFLTQEKCPLLKVYHLTTREAAEGIVRHGFRDGLGAFLTSRRHSGVWVSDRPLVGLSCIDDVACFEIESPAAGLAPCEWLEEGKPYREFLVPAAVLNRSHYRLLTDDELFAIPWDRRTPPALAVALFG
jgi:hypothetical protein